MAPTATSTSPMLTLTFTKFPTCKWKQHHLKNQVAEIQGPKRTVNLDFSFLRNSSLATSTPRDIKDFLRHGSPCIADESKEFAGLLSKPLKSQSPPRMLQTCLKRLKKTWQDFGNGFMSTEQFVMSTSRRASKLPAAQASPQAQACAEVVSNRLQNAKKRHNVWHVSTSQNKTSWFYHGFINFNPCSGMKFQHSSIWCYQHVTLNPDLGADRLLQRFAVWTWQGVHKYHTFLTSNHKGTVQQTSIHVHENISTYDIISTIKSYNKQ